MKEIRSLFHESNGIQLETFIFILTKKNDENAEQLKKFQFNKVAPIDRFPHFQFLFQLFFRKKTTEIPNLIKSFISSRLARKTMTNAVCDLKKITVRPKIYEF